MHPGPKQARASNLIIHTTRFLACSTVVVIASLQAFSGLRFEVGASCRIVVWVGACYPSRREYHHGISPIPAPRSLAQVLVAYDETHFGMSGGVPELRNAL